MIRLLHDSRSAAYRSPTGAQKAHSAVTLRLLAEGDDVESVTLRLWWENTEKRLSMRPEGEGRYACRLILPSNTGVLWYFFIVRQNGRDVYYGNAWDQLGGEGAIYAQEPPSFQITVYDPAYETPAWMRRGILYQIFPDRFNASRPPAKRVPLPFGHYHDVWNEPPELNVDPATHDNLADDFFGGDLAGITQKLDYLEDLGVTALYLNPIFRARSNHKYNTGDYLQIDPSFGTQEELRSLCREAKKRGMRVILDGVFSHTGSDSRYFNRLGTYDSVGAYQSRQSPYASWYTFRRWPDDYESWWGFDTLPNVRELDEGYLDFIIRGEDAVCAHYLRQGTSGWRLDVADELPMPFLRQLRARVKAENPDAILLGEVWEDASRKLAYNELRSYCLGDTLDSVTNYPLRDGIVGFFLGRLDARQLKRILDSQYENYPKAFYCSLMNLLGSHDKPRILNVLAGADEGDVPREQRVFRPLTEEQYALGRERLIRAWRFVCALPGMPCLYYGDEAGSQGGDDPFCRGTYPWGREDQGLLLKIRAANRERLASPVLREGEVQLIAESPDRLTVVRTLPGERYTYTLTRE